MDIRFTLTDWILLFKKHGCSFPKDSDMELMKNEEFHQKRLEDIRWLLMKEINKPRIFNIIHPDFLFSVISSFAALALAYFVFILTIESKPEGASLAFIGFLVVILTSWIVATYRTYTEAKKREDLEKYGGQRMLNALIDLCSIEDERIAQFCANLWYWLSGVKEMWDRNIPEPYKNKIGFLMSAEMRVNSEIRNNYKQLWIAIDNYLENKKVCYKAFISTPALMASPSPILQSSSGKGL